MAGESFAGVAASTAAYAAAFLAFWAAFAALRRGRDVCGVAAGTWGLKCVMLLHHVIVGPLALASVWNDPALRRAFSCFGCSEAAPQLLRDPSAGPSAVAAALVPVTLGYMAADLALIGQWNLKGAKAENALMVAHHLLSMASWPFALVYDFGARYVLVLLAYEVSSIFLVFQWMLSTAGMKQGSAYIANGVLFTGSFLLLRVASAFPQLLAMWNAPPWEASPDEYGILWWMPYGSTFLILPHLLNFFWGVKVVRGALALLRSGGGGGGGGMGGGGGRPKGGAALRRDEEPAKDRERLLG